MRYLVFASVTTAVVLSGCAESPSPRPERANLLSSATSLTGRPLEQQADGPWVVRRFASAPGGSSEGETSRDFTADAEDVRMFSDSGEADPRARLGELVLRAEPAADAAPGAELKLSVPSGSAPEEELEEVAVVEESMGHAGVVLETAREAITLPSLRAGSSDDNQDFDAYLAFLTEQREAGSLAGCQDLDVSQRHAIRVLDENGTPVPAASVRVVDADRDTVLWRGASYGDGRVPFYRGLLPADVSASFVLEVEHEGRSVRENWNGKGDELIVRMPGTAARDEVELDVVFLIDTTGSMSDEIERIKQSLLGTTQKLRNVDREFDLRYGAVLYRDVTDQFVTMAHPFTSDIAAFDRALQGIEASGGGDTPESLNQGLAVAVDGMEWRPGAAKLVFLVADAPPHMDYQDDVAYGDSARAAIARGIKIHAVAASGLDMTGTIVFRQIAQLTRGKFIFIEYGSNVAKSAESHGVKGEVKSNNLDDILFEQIRDEIAMWGRDA